jgi:aspartyl-tRNA(Asn)/glutamyl-tRNA(Gln) amidotransferase subunit A
MADLLDLDITAARAGLDRGDFSAVELTQAYLDAMARGRHLNCFITETPEIALEMAAKSDARIAAGTAGPLEGVPMGIKDLFCTDGTLTTAASHILDGFKPAYESTVTSNLWRAGAVMLGKMNLDEFAMGSANTTSYYGPVENPWKRVGEPETKLVPGGSSGGSASAISARLALGTIGTDTGGSIRQPASFTGIVGIKPTYGRCSRWGVVAFASSLDQAGPFGRSVADSALLLQAMSGHDAKDSTSAELAVPDFASAVKGDIKGLRIGIPAEYRVDDMPGEIEGLWQRGLGWLKDAGAEIVDINLPHTKYALPTYYIIAPAEASSNLARYDGVRYGLRVEADSLIDMYEATRGEGFGAEVKRRVMIGTYVLSAGYYDAYYIKAQKVRGLIRRDFDQAFDKVDAILTPTAPSDAFPIGEREDDPVKMYLNDVFTVPANLAGLPGISVPGGLSAAGLPLGLQVLARPFDEMTMLRVASAVEQAAGFDTKPAFQA